MRELRLRTAGSESRIVIGAGLVDRLEEVLPRRPSTLRGALIVDGRLRRVAARVVRSLAERNIVAVPFVIPGGERSKSAAAWERLMRGFARERLERGSPVFALGGGTIGDLAGFAASTWLRGVPFNQIPTTLLAQVDASVGGKTGLNLPEGKNLVGSFHQPELVIVDPALLDTLPAREFTGGLAEVVKTGMIADAALFVHIEKRRAAILERDPAVLEEIIHRCLSIKASIVEKDEREAGPRAALNYGHTLGHAIEAAGGFSRFHHGEAVSLGMEAAAYIAMRMGLASVETLAAQNRLLAGCGLPTRATGLPRREILKALELDKKRRQGRPRFVLPERIGRVRIGVEVEPGLVDEALKAIGGRSA